MVVAGGELENQLKMDGRIHMHWKENSPRIVAEAMTFSGCADQVSLESIVSARYSTALLHLCRFIYRTETAYLRFTCTLLNLTEMKA